MAETLLDVAGMRVMIINAFVRPTTEDRGSNDGNPAAVVLLTAAEASALSDKSRQAVAAYMNLSETAFVHALEAPLSFALRWFTPRVEVKLCGHATLASAAAVIHAGWASPGDTLCFHTLSGILKVDTSQADQSIPPFTMRFPLLSMHTELSAEVETVLLTALGLTRGDTMCVFRSDYDIVVQVSRIESVKNLEPNIALLKSVETRGVIVTAQTNDGFCSRFFAPRVGLDEDPVTGSAQCALAALYLRDGAHAIAKQMSARGGVVMVRRAQDDVHLGGWVHVVASLVLGRES